MSDRSGALVAPQVGPTAGRVLAHRGATPAAALASGAMVGLAWEPFGLWPLAVLGVAALMLLVAPRPGRTRWRDAAATGWWFGLGMNLVAIGWVHVIGWYVVPPLVGFMALWSSLAALVTRAAWCSGHPLIRAVATAAGWSLAEFGASRVPFGGFGWLRLGFTQVDSPLRGWFPVVGVAGVSLVVALLGSLLAAAATAGRPVHRVAPAVVAAALCLGAPLAGRTPARPAKGQVVAGIVQGNLDGSAGPHAMGYARSVTENHVAQTVDLMARVRSGALPAPAFVVWPENSTDVDPRLDASTHELLMTASRIAQVPILVGAVTSGPGPDERQTTALWWPTSGFPGARYDKRNLVPFGEWIPLRSQLLPLLPVLEQVGPQSVPGTTPGVLDVTLDDGRRLALGDVICFELAWDGTVYDTVRHGAGVVAVQSNLGTYTGTAQPPQQLAITRARAMELRRELVVATTNSDSGLVLPDGTTTAMTTPRTAASRSVVVPVRQGATPAVVVGPLLEQAAAALGALALAVGLLTDRRPRRGGAPARG